MGPQSLDDVFVPPVSSTFSRLGPSDLSNFQCAMDCSQNASSSGHQDYNPNEACDHHHVRFFRRDPSQRPRKLLTSIPMTKLACQYPVFWTERSIDKPLIGLGKPLQHPLSHCQIQAAETTATHLDRDLLHLVSYSAAPGLANYHTRPSTAELLPPINLISPARDPIVSAQKSSSVHSFAEQILFSLSSLRIDQHLSSCGTETVPSPDTLKSFEVAPLCAQQSLGLADNPSRRRSLHKTLGSRELRRQAHEQPVTSPRKSRLWLEASSSEESVKHAVSAPKICTRGMLRLHYLSMLPL